MIKYVIDKKNDNDHWNYCVQNDTPYVKIFSARKFARIEFDVVTMLNNQRLPKGPAQSIEKMYMSYIEFFKFPKDKWHCVGGSYNLIFTVYQEHAEFIASHLFDYLDDFVKTNRR